MLHQRPASAAKHLSHCVDVKHIVLISRSWKINRIWDHKTESPTGSLNFYESLSHFLYLMTSYWYISRDCCQLKCRNACWDVIFVRFPLSSGVPPLFFYHFWILLCSFPSPLIVSPFGIFASCPLCSLAGHPPFTTSSCPSIDLTIPLCHWWLVLYLWSLPSPWGLQLSV